MIEEYPHTGIGIIKYDPYRYKMKTRTRWWCILDIDKELTRYYRYWIQSTYGLKLYNPAWDAHISIIRGEKPFDIDLWKKYDGIEVEFKYSHVVYPNNMAKFFAIKIHSDSLLHIRKELQLPTDYGLHCTIGKTYDKLDNISLKHLYKNI